MVRIICGRTAEIVKMYDRKRSFVTDITEYTETRIIERYVVRT